VICPGGGTNPRDRVPAKRWGAERCATLAAALAAQGRRVLLAGGAGDRTVLRAVAQEAARQGARIETLEPSIPELGGLLARCGLLVTNDSAPLHLGLALGAPTVALFGPTNPRALTPPDARRLKVIESPLPCSPCYSNSLFPGCDNPRCMDAIATDEVLDACLSMLSSRNRRPSP